MTEYLHEFIIDDNESNVCMYLEQLLFCVYFWLDFIVCGKYSNFKWVTELLCFVSWLRWKYFQLMNISVSNQVYSRLSHFLETDFCRQRQIMTNLDASLMLTIAFSWNFALSFCSNLLQALFDTYLRMKCYHLIHLIYSMCNIEHLWQ